MKILIIEDDKLFRTKLETDLTSLGYQVGCYPKYDQMIDNEKYDIALLDINLPNQNGIDYITKLTSSGVKVVMLTSSNHPRDEFESLNLGAIDFITKPYFLATLDLKLKRLVEKNDHIISYNGNELDLSQMKLNDSISLSKKEMQIIFLLMENSKQEVSKKTILNLLWETDIYIEQNNLNVTISRLRKKLEGTNMTITTIARKGYRLD